MAVAGSLFVGAAALLSLVLRGDYAPLAATMALVVVPYLILQEWTRTNSSWVRRVDIAHVMAGPWLLTWSQAPWLGIAIACLIATLLLMLAVGRGKHLEF
jgi:hypothetical protein